MVSTCATACCAVQIEPGSWSERIGGASEPIEPCERLRDAVAQLASSGVD